MSLIRWVRVVRQRRRAARELDDELAFHLAMQTEANVARGMTPEDARRAALRAFGGVTHTRESVRAVRTFAIESVWHDVRYACRTLAAHRRFTLAAVAMLGLAVGVTTAMFTIADALVVRPIPFAEPQELAQLYMGDEHGGRLDVAPPVLTAWRQAPAFQGVESASAAPALLEVDGTVVERDMAAVTPGIFNLLGGVRPVRGTLFDARDAGYGDRLLMSETVWRTLFNSDPAMVGRTIRIDRVPMTVVGILPADFRFPSATTVLWRPTDLRGAGERASAYVRFRRDVPQADALRLASDAARAADSTTARLHARTYPLAGMPDAYAQRAIRLLTGSVILVFLVLCANVCSLLLARLATRRAEFSTRAAIGASRGRLVRQALVESSVLGVIGIVAGVGVAGGLMAIARALLPSPLLVQSLNPIDIDQRALLATAAIGLVATVLAGVLPAWFGTRVDAVEGLRTADRTRTESRGARLSTQGLLVAEIAFAFALLVGATLLTRSFINLVRADRGLDTTGVTTLWLALPPTTAGPNDGPARQLLARSIEDELRQLPGVRQLAWSYGLPPRGGILTWGDWITDLPGNPAVNLHVSRYVVSHDFFPLYGIPILRGRSFIPTDPYPNVIVSEEFARRLWPQADPVGRTFRIDQERFEVIGVARETHYPAIDSRLDEPEFYHPYTATVATPMVSLRCEPGCPDSAVIRHRLASTHPDVRVQDAGPLDVEYARQLARPRAAAALAAAFAAIAVLAAAGGLFSVLSYFVTRRRREFGVRAALGAVPRHIRAVVLRDAMVIGAAGITIGTLPGAGLASALASLQYGVTAADPLSWSVVIGLIALTTGIASWAPARAASKTDPVVLLRHE